jgi:hypothetical protein
VGFVVDKVTEGQLFSQYFGFPCQLSSHRVLQIHRHLSSGAGTIDQVKIYELATNSKNKNFGDLHRGINEFKCGHHTRSNLVKDEKADLLAASHKISNSWNNYSLLLNVHSVSDVRRIEIHTAEPLVPVHSPSVL